MTTQIMLAREGKISEEMHLAAEFEGVNPEMVREGLAAGTAVLCKNVNRSFKPRAVGKGFTTKINVNIGTSGSHCNLKEELEKLEITLEKDADSVMDLSTSGDLDATREQILKCSSIMVGTVPIYALAETYARRDKKVIHELDPDDLFHEIDKQGKQGVDFMTVHCGITRESLGINDRSERVMGIVSRGGSMLVAWMRYTGKENPLNERFDDLLCIAAKYDITLSLGDGMRPGAIADADDRAQLMELVLLGDLVARAHAKGVQVMIEGPGHVPLSRIKGNILLQKKLCNQVPYYVLGPLPTDIAPGYDHIVSAIGGAIAAAAGADFLCYVTPAEHLKLPNKDDVYQGIIAARIAAHIGDLEKGIPSAWQRDLEMSKARKRLDWDGMYRYALDGQAAREKRESSEDFSKEYCTMCGNLCAIKNDNETR